MDILNGQKFNDQQSPGQSRQVNLVVQQSPGPSRQGKLDGREFNVYSNDQQSPGPSRQQKLDAQKSYDQQSPGPNKKVILNGQEFNDYFNGQQFPGPSRQEHLHGQEFKVYSNDQKSPGQSRQGKFDGQGFNASNDQGSNASNGQGSNASNDQGSNDFNEQLDSNEPSNDESNSLKKSSILVPAFKLLILISLHYLFLFPFLEHLNDLETSNFKVPSFSQLFINMSFFMFTLIFVKVFKKKNLYRVNLGQKSKSKSLDPKKLSKNLDFREGYKPDQEQKSLFPEPDQDQQSSTSLSPDQEQKSNFPESDQDQIPSTSLSPDQDQKPLFPDQDQLSSYIPTHSQLHHTITSLTRLLSFNLLVSFLYLILYTLFKPLDVEKHEIASFFICLYYILLIFSLCFLNSLKGSFLIRKDKKSSSNNTNFEEKNTDLRSKSEPNENLKAKKSKTSSLWSNFKHKIGLKKKKKENEEEKNSSEDQKALNVDKETNRESIFESIPSNILNSKCQVGQKSESSSSNDPDGSKKSEPDFDQNSEPDSDQNSEQDSDSNENSDDDSSSNYLSSSSSNLSHKIKKPLKKYVKKPLKRMAKKKALNFAWKNPQKAAHIGSKARAKVRRSNLASKLLLKLGMRKGQKKFRKLEKYLQFYFKKSTTKQFLMTLIFIQLTVCFIQLATSMFLGGSVVFRKDSWENLGVFENLKCLIFSLLPQNLLKTFPQNLKSLIFDKPIGFLSSLNFAFLLPTLCLSLISSFLFQLLIDSSEIERREKLKSKLFQNFKLIFENFRLNWGKFGRREKLKFFVCQIFACISLSFAVFGLLEWLNFAHFSLHFLCFLVFVGEVSVMCGCGEMKKKDKSGKS